MLPATGSGGYAAALAPVQLYNGNIPSMLTALQDLAGANLALHANVYRYDLLNRIKAQTVYKGANSGSDLSGLTTNNEYNTAYDFDANGNFDRHQRLGNLGGTQIMDDLQYWYLTETNALYTPSQATLPSDRTNKLAYVHEAAPVTTTGEDLEDQENISPYPNDYNYAYDEQGRLTQDILAGIGPNGIKWNLQDKVRRVTRDPILPNNAATPDLEFRYGATGHRTVKVIKPRSGGVQQPASEWVRTYYIHDAQGNPMSIYRRTYQANGGTSYTDKLQQEDALVYGSARLGAWKPGRMKQRSLTSPSPAMTNVTYSAVPGNFWSNGQGGYPTTALSVTRRLGLRHYELANHVGNVLSTVSDRRMAVASGGVLAYYRAEEKSFADYDPGGSLLPGRNYSSSTYHYGFNGMRKDDEINGATGTSYDFGARLYDPRVGRWLSLDPKAAKYPSLSPYNFVANSPIWAIDPNGEEIVIVGSDSYRRFVTQALIGLMTSKEGKRMVEAMSASNHKIVFADAGLTSNQLLGRFDNGDGTSTYEINLTTLNAFNEFERPEFSKEPLSKSPSTSAYHEMRHVEQIMVGAVAEIPVRALNDRQVGMEEVDAVFGENMVRDQLGMPLRIYYGNSEVFPATWGDYEHTDQGLQMHLREGDWSTNWKTLPPVPEGAKFKTSTSDASSVRTQQIRPAPTDKATSIKLQ